MNQSQIDQHARDVQLCIRKLDATVIEIREYLETVGPLHRLRWCLEEAVALYDELGFAPDMMFSDPDRAKRWLNNAKSALKDCK